MNPKTALLFGLLIASAVGAAAQGPNIDPAPDYGKDPYASAAPSSAKLSVPARHYLPSPSTGAAYQQEIASQRTRGAGLKLISVAAESVSFRSAESRPRVVEAVYTTASSNPALYSHMSNGRSLRGHSTGDDLIDGFIVESSQRYGVDPLLTLAQMGQESSYRRGAVSPKGATGLMQLMPATARRMGVTNIYDPQQNIEGGVKYMRLLLDMFDNNIVLALAGYNAGEAAVIKYGYQVPPYSETMNYVQRIAARYRSISGR